jgi:hypothetical protein
MDGRSAESIDECVQRLLEGESLDDVLMSHPGMGAQLLPALEPAIALLQTPLVEPSPLARNSAMNAMMRQVRKEAARPAPAGVFRWLGSLRARPLAFQSLAVAGALVLFGGLGIGASAATGTTPAPVRSFFRISSESEHKVHLGGAIVSIGDGSLVIRTESGDRTLLLTASTIIDRGGQKVDASGLRVGEDVEVTGVERPDGGVIARQVREACAGAPGRAAVFPAGTPRPPRRPRRTALMMTGMATPPEATTAALNSPVPRRRTRRTTARTSPMTTRTMRRPLTNRHTRATTTARPRARPGTSPGTTRRPRSLRRRSSLRTTTLPTTAIRTVSTPPRPNPAAPGLPPPVRCSVTGQ